MTVTIKKLLVANRGEIASRVFRTCRLMDIATVAVYSDADAGLPFVTDADEAVRLPGNTPADTYLRADLLIEAALRTGADAIHPGYGFLSENAGFARRCAAAGVTFVGPTPEAMDAMGSKTAAKELMHAAGVPVLPGAVFAGDREPDAARLRTAAAEIGTPVLVKAAFGGGGRGMRIVQDLDEIEAAVASARREAASAFGDGTVFLERFVESPRHIEVQIVGDQAGTVVHLFERECSIQRRYQKIIEEAPSPVVDDALRAELCQAAVSAGKAIGYVGAGTVEFVLDASGRFYFLEVNTRLQVEHPVTEMITGIDLVRLQLDIAAGRPIPDEVIEARITGHAIEARLYAEDAAAGYLPTSGAVHTFELPPADGLRIDAGFASGTRVSTFYDSMLAKVIGFGATRDDARRLLAGSLSRARLHGVTTNRDLLVGILREAEFAAGAIDTGYLQRHAYAELVPTPGEDARAVHVLAAALAGQAARRAEAPVLASLPSGFRTNPSAPQTVAFERHGREPVEATYRLDRDGLTATVAGAPVAETTLLSATPTRVDLVCGGIRRVVDVHRVGATVYVDSPLGHDALTEVERFPDPSGAAQAGSLIASMPGTVVRIEAAVGDSVESGATILVIEAMKMEHAIRSPGSGIVTALPVGIGTQVDSGAVLAVVDDKDGAEKDGAEKDTRERDAQEQDAEKQDPEEERHD
ncbi:biotin carboxylase N-terminal domain-containing protein [Streptomyces sp. NPDC051985]|uniref:acetyl/propionyl/methylcrotonyl-CoA carboxylase subunit alpha n=1 Tax=Streptomyces sp. NPDC051985 TaxID=3155807 RepID=UPI003440789F